MTYAAVVRSEGFTPPSPADFDLPSIGGGDETFTMFGQEFVLGITKPMLQLVLAAVIVFVIFWAASRWLMLPSLARLSHSSSSRSCWLIAIRSIL